MCRLEAEAQTSALGREVVGMTEDGAGQSRVLAPEDPGAGTRTLRAGERADQAALDTALSDQTDDAAGLLLAPQRSGRKRQ